MKYRVSGWVRVPAGHWSQWNAESARLHYETCCDSHLADIYVWQTLRCCAELSAMEVLFSKWCQSVKKGVMDLFLSISMAYNVILCQKVAENTQSLNSLCKSGSRPQKSPKKAQKTDHSIAIYSIFWIGMVYFGWHLVNPHVQPVQNMYGKGGSRVYKAEL